MIGTTHFRASSPEPNLFTEKKKQKIIINQHFLITWSVNCVYLHTLLPTSSLGLFREPLHFPRLASAEFEEEPAGRGVSWPPPRAVSRPFVGRSVGNLSLFLSYFRCFKDIAAEDFLRSTLLHLNFPFPRRNVRSATRYAETRCCCSLCGNPSSVIYFSVLHLRRLLSTAQSLTD